MIIHKKSLPLIFCLVLSISLPANALILLPERRNVTTQSENAQKKSNLKNHVKKFAKKASDTIKKVATPINIFITLAGILLIAQIYFIYSAGNQPDTHTSRPLTQKKYFVRQKLFQHAQANPFINEECWQLAANLNHLNQDQINKLFTLFQAKSPKTSTEEITTQILEMIPHVTPGTTSINITDVKSTSPRPVSQQGNSNHFPSNNQASYQSAPFQNRSRSTVELNGEQAQELLDRLFRMSQPPVRRSEDSDSNETIEEQSFNHILQANRNQENQGPDSSQSPAVSSVQYDDTECPICMDAPQEVLFHEPFPKTSAPHKGCKKCLSKIKNCPICNRML